ncbi:MAG: nucleotidyltransferase domain-containing protein [Flavipsychrobacter sp.]
MQVANRNKELESRVLSTLQYFHVFTHPLFVDDIYRYLSETVSIGELNNVLDDMEKRHVIYKHKDMYMLVNNPALTDKRIKGEAIAQKRLQKAKLSTKIIAQFPFVSSICISGSLSKGYADDNSDIDFFIITKAKRLWICRTTLHLFKKLTFLFGKQHSFCMNYFIDESYLELEEQNKFTATELVTLIPVYNRATFEILEKKNSAWVKELLPNASWNENKTVPDNKSFIKAFAEFMFNILWPEQLNSFLMKLTDRRWRKKWMKRNYPMAEYDLAMKTKWYVSKHHPSNNQKKVLEVQINRADIQTAH